MADHSALALAGAYCRYLYERTGTPPSAMREAYFRSTGETPAGYPHRFRKWLGQRVYMMDQLGKHPFPDDDR